MREWNKIEKSGNTITEVMIMRNKNDKQKRSLIFSTAVVITGCIATAVYVNQSMNTATDYKIDLSQVNVSEESGNSLVNDPELGSGASLARVSGQDVVNTYPPQEDNSAGETGNKESGVKESGTKETGNKETGEKSSADKDEQAAQDGELKEKETGEASEEAAQTASQSVIAPAADLSFSPEDGMGWPLAGDVILNYSMDSAVYFATLMQYKYNPAILIGAEQGANVSACAKGQVVGIGESAEQGKYVVMNVGDGYEITYGQLENLQVEKGTVVSRGQVIGNVAKTTKYYSVEGDHVSLMVTKDGKPVDPLSLLE